MYIFTNVNKNSSIISTSIKSIGFSNHLFKTGLSEKSNLVSVTTRMSTLLCNNFTAFCMPISIFNLNSGKRNGSSDEHSNATCKSHRLV